MKFNEKKRVKRSLPGIKKRAYKQTNKTVKLPRQNSNKANYVVSNVICLLLRLPDWQIWKILLRFFVAMSAVLFDSLHRQYWWILEIPRKKTNCNRLYRQLGNVYNRIDQYLMGNCSNNRELHAIVFLHLPKYFDKMLIKLEWIKCKTIGPSVEY